MRPNLYLRGIDLLDVELHAGRINVAVFRPREDDTAAAPKLTASSGGQFEQAEPMQPDTPVFGYGTRPESRMGEQTVPDTAVMGFTNRQGVVR